MVRKIVTILFRSYTQYFGLFFISLMSYSSFSQVSFFPLKAKWRYLEGGLHSPPFSAECKDYSEYEVEKDTIILSKPAKKVSKKEFENDTLKATLQCEYFYQDGKKVYFFNRFSQMFHLLFDFGAKAGDTIKVFDNQLFYPPFENQSAPTLKSFIEKPT